MYKSILNGVTPLDTDGNKIQCHGGKIYYFNNKYYWIGENKELTDGISNIWHNGVRCYESEDLLNWKSDGIIVEASELESSTLNRSSYMDRPHVLYNKKNDEYVMWLKIMNKDDTQDMTILKSKDILGPYELIKEHYHPFDFSTGDFDLILDGDGKAYWFFEMVHFGFAVTELEDDFMNIKKGTLHILEEGTRPPYTREAMAYFNYKGHHYLLTSGTTGYNPNPTIAYELETITGPVIKKFSPLVNDINNNSFNSQISGVFKVSDKLYLSIADRWLPYSLNSYDNIKVFYDLVFTDHVKEALEYEKTLHEDIKSTKDSLYVILPIKFNYNDFIIEFMEEVVL